MDIRRSIWCKRNSIIYIALYPNASHILQPCEAGFFGPLKSVYTTEVQVWKSENPGKDFKLIHFVPVLSKAHEKTVKPETIINSFKTTTSISSILSQN